MVDILYTYALLKTFHESGKDYIDSFWPLLLKGFTKKEFIDKEKMRTFLELNYDIKMPYHVLDSVLERLMRKRFISRKKDSFKIRNSGLEYLDTLDSEDFIERKINSLLADMHEFYKENDKVFSINEIHTSLLKLIRNNIYSLVESVNPSITFNVVIDRIDDIDKLIIEYIRIANDKKPIHYLTLQEMIFGSLISSILYTKDYTDYSVISLAKFKDIIVYLDTNYLIYLLELDYKEKTQPAIELYNLMILNGIKIKVFGTTVDELCRVLNGYDNYRTKYPVNLEIGHLHSFLKQNGWTKSKMREYIIHIEDNLKEKGIEIDYDGYIKLIHYKPSKPEIVMNIMKYKPDLSIDGIYHDLYAMNRIQTIRKRPFRIFDSARNFFLTSDLKLNKFNMLEMGHKQNGTIGEVLLDRTFTNLLWLRKPENNPSLTSIISAHTDVLIKPSVWEEFYRILSELKNSERISYEDITMLFYDDNMEAILSKFDSHEVNKVTSDLIIEQIERARDIEGEIRHEIKSEYESEYESLIKEQKKEMEIDKQSEIEKIIEEKEKESEEEWYNFYNNLKEQILLISTEKGNQYANIVAILLSAIYIILSYAFMWIAQENNILAYYQLFMTLVGVGGIYGYYKTIRKSVSKRLKNSIFEKKLKELNIQELEKIELTEKQDT